MAQTGDFILYVACLSVLNYLSMRLLCNIATQADGVSSNPKTPEQLIGYSPWAKVCSQSTV